MGIRPRAVTAILSLLVAAVLLPARPAVAAVDVYGGDQFRTSVASRCTVAFTVVGRVTPFNGFLTTGRCGRISEPVYTLGGQLMGYFVATSYPGNDYALVQLNPGWTPRGGVRTGATIAPVKGSTEAPVGASVCRTGVTSGWRCGTVVSKNATVNFPDGVIYGLTRTNVCAEPGDTGAPFLAGSQAQGILSGGSGNCTTGGTSYFQPVNEALNAYDVRLVTS